MSASDQSYDEMARSYGFENMERFLREIGPRENGKFRLLLKRLRKQLSNPIEFERLVKQGIRTIILMRSHVQNEELVIEFGRWYEYDLDPKVYGEDLCRSELALLRDTLCDKALFDQLAQVGPCELLLSTLEESEGSHGILIRNFISTTCMPNSDWSIHPQGFIWFHS
jgi:hypothetical protein